MTITEKILARACGQEEVRAGDFVNARLDLALANDITAPLAIQEFEAAGMTKVWDPEKVVLVCDHFVPNKDIKSAEQAKLVRDFARRQGLTNFFDVGRMGIEHVILPEKGLVVPGDVVIGADSHTCTYGALGAFATGVGTTDLAAGMATGEVWLRVPETIRFNYEGEPGRYVTGKDYILYTIGLIGVDGALYQAMEFGGGAIESLSMDGRFTMCNMAIEAGGKNGIVEPDDDHGGILPGPRAARAGDDEQRRGRGVCARDRDRRELDRAAGGQAASAVEYGAGVRSWRT